MTLQDLANNIGSFFSQKQSGGLLTPLANNLGQQFQAVGDLIHQNNLPTPQLNSPAYKIANVGAKIQTNYAEPFLRGYSSGVSENLPFIGQNFHPETRIGQNLGFNLPTLSAGAGVATNAFLSSQLGGLVNTAAAPVTNPFLENAAKVNPLWGKVVAGGLKGAIGGGLQAAIIPNNNPREYGKRIRNAAAISGAIGAAVPIAQAGVKKVSDLLSTNQIPVGLSTQEVSPLSKADQLQLKQDFASGKLTSEQYIEQMGGWQPGLRARFDQAMQNGDATTIKKLLPDVPEAYKQRFSEDISNILSKQSQVSGNPVSEETQNLIDSINNQRGGVGDIQAVNLEDAKAALNAKAITQDEYKALIDSNNTDQLFQDNLAQAGGNRAAGTASDNPSVVAEAGRRARASAMESVRVRAGNIANEANSTLKGGDNYLFRYALENPNDAESVAQLSSDPQGFTDLVNKYSDFTDYVAKSLKDVAPANRMNYVNDYYTHIWDQSTPEDRALYQDFLAKYGKNFVSGFTKERSLGSIQEGLDMGLRLKNEKVAQDIGQYANSMNTQIGASAFNQAINNLRPGGAITTANGGADTYNYKGQIFRQSNVPGNQGTFIDPEIQKQLDYYNPSGFANNPVVAGKDITIAGHDIHIPGADKINQVIKETKLALGGFHGFNTTLREMVNDPLTIPQAIHNTFDSGANRDFIQNAIDDGTIDYGAKIGVTYDVNGDVLPQDASFLDTIGSKNPITKFNNRLFGGLINTYKINLTRSMMDKFPDIATDPAEAQAAQAYGAQINDLMGGLNYEALGRNKTVQQSLRLLGLAPDFNEGTLRTVAQAANPKNYASDIQRPAALFAAKQVVGQVALWATITEIVRRVVTGNFSKDFSSFVQDSILKPNFALPNSPTFNNPQTNTTQISRFPSTEFNTLAGAVQDPNHFLQARGSALISAGSSLASGKDYFGNPLTPKGQEDNLFNRLKGLAPSQLPIPVVQGLNIAQNKVTPAVAGLNTVGFRVNANPNDPASAFWDKLINQDEPVYQKYLDLVKTGDPSAKDYFNQHLQQITEYKQLGKYAQAYSAYKKQGNLQAANDVIRQAGLGDQTLNPSTGAYSTPSTGSTGSTGGINQSYIYVDNAGKFKNVDLTTPITKPPTTGNTTLDKLATSKYNSAITTRVNNIYTLYQDGKITQDQAAQELNSLSTQKITAPKKAKKVTVKITKPKTIKIKVAKASKIPKFKLPKTPTIKTIKSTKTPTLKFKAYKVPTFKNTLHA